MTALLPPPPPRPAPELQEAFYALDHGVQESYLQNPVLPQLGEPTRPAPSHPASSSPPSRPPHPRRPSEEAALVAAWTPSPALLALPALRPRLAVLSKLALRAASPPLDSGRLQAYALALQDLAAALGGAVSTLEEQADVLRRACGAYAAAARLSLGERGEAARKPSRGERGSQAEAEELDAPGNGVPHPETRPNGDRTASGSSAGPRPRPPPPPKALAWLYERGPAPKAAAAAPYNHGVALSDLARLALHAGRPKDARACLSASLERYRLSLACDPGNAQAWNNAGLALQELAAATQAPEAARQLRLEALAHFRAAMRLRPAWDRAAYNLGAGLHAAAGSPGLVWDPPPPLAHAAQYVALAYAAEPLVHAAALRMVYAQLPRPFLRVGEVLARCEGAAGVEAWAPARLRLGAAGLGLERRHLRESNGTLSPQGGGAAPSAPAWPAGLQEAELALLAPGAREESALPWEPAPGEGAGGGAAGLLRLPAAHLPKSIPLEDVAGAGTCADAALPPGTHGVWVDLRSARLGWYFASPSAEDARGWVDALRALCQLRGTLVGRRLVDVLGG